MYIFRVCIPFSVGSNQSPVRLWACSSYSCLLCSQGCLGTYNLKKTRESLWLRQHQNRRHVVTVGRSWNCFNFQFWHHIRLKPQLHYNTVMLIQCSIDKIMNKEKQFLSTSPSWCKYTSWFVRPRSRINGSLENHKQSLIVSSSTHIPETGISRTTEECS